MKERSSGTKHEVWQRFSRVASAREAVIFGIAIGLFVIFNVISGGLFISSDVIGVMAISASELGIVVLGVALLMICGEFDLSVGSVSAVGALIMATLYQLGLNPFLAMAIAVCGGMGAGAVNGLVTVKFGIPSFIVTLGTMMAWRGFVTLITGGLTIPFLVREIHPAFFSVLQAHVGVVPAPLIWFVVTIIVLVLLLHFHRFGNHVFATGGNKEAARAMGINTNKTKVICFMIVGGLAAFSGIMQTIRGRGFQALQGTGMELMAIAAVVVGGTSLFGGTGTIVGAALGVLIIIFLRFGLIMARLPGFWYKLALGVIIVAVVAMNKVLEQRRKI
ncbi:Inner membrane ABC transporter permease protein YjfF [subsurface metagenome]